MGHSPGQPQEVIQPHLPVRLPCYDLPPLPGETLDEPGLPDPPQAPPGRVGRRAVSARPRDVFTARC